MSGPTNHWKLGLFVVMGTLVGGSALLFLGARSLRKETVSYRSYFDEAVSGLDVGSSVSFRGVRLGDVSVIEVAPDRRHVEVIYRLETSVLSRMGLAYRDGREWQVAVPPDLRVQLSTTSLTGGKYLKFDFFDPQKYPPPELPFTPDKHYIPATPSTLKSLEDPLLRAVDQLPELVADVKAILEQTNELLIDIRSKALPERATELLARADHVMVTLEGTLRDLHAKELSEQARTTLINLNSTLAEMHGLVERVNREDGLLESIKRASDAIGDFTQSAGPAGGDLDETLRSLREMADSVRQLTDALERDSDMLIKGRAKEKLR